MLYTPAMEKIKSGRLFVSIKSVKGALVGYPICYDARRIAGNSQRFTADELDALNIVGYEIKPVPLNNWALEKWKSDLLPRSVSKQFNRVHGGPPRKWAPRRRLVLD